MATRNLFEEMRGEFESGARRHPKRFEADLGVLSQRIDRLYFTMLAGFLSMVDARAVAALLG